MPRSCRQVSECPHLTRSSPSAVTALEILFQRREAEPLARCPQSMIVIGSGGDCADTAKGLPGTSVGAPVLGSRV